MRSELKSEVMGGRCDQSSVDWRYKQTSLLSFFFLSLSPLLLPDGDWEIQHGPPGIDEDVWGDEETLFCHSGNPWVIISISLLYSLGDGSSSLAVVYEWPSPSICHRNSPHSVRGVHIFHREKAPKVTPFFHYVSLRVWARTPRAWYRARPRCLGAV